MIIDSALQFCNATSVVGAAGTALLGSQIDTTIAGTVDADDLYLVILVATDIVVASSTGKIRFQLASDTTAAISTSTATVGFQTQDFTTSTTAIPAGSVLAVIELPKQSGVYNPMKRFIGILSVITTTAISAGAITAFLTPDGGRWAALPVVVN